MQENLPTASASCSHSPTSIRAKPKRKLDSRKSTRCLSVRDTPWTFSPSIDPSVKFGVDNHSL
jgi:hypothetical protein